LAIAWIGDMFLILEQTGGCQCGRI